MQRPISAQRPTSDVALRASRTDQQRRIVQSGEKSLFYLPLSLGQGTDL